MKSRLLVAAVGVPLLFYIVLGAPPIVMMAALCALSGVAAMDLMQCVGIGQTELPLRLDGHLRGVLRHLVLRPAGVYGGAVVPLCTGDILLCHL